MLLARSSVAAAAVSVASRGGSGRSRVSRSGARSGAALSRLCVTILAAGAAPGMSSSAGPPPPPPPSRNVLGGPLECCCTAPMTGYYRDGFCRTGGGDFGVHVVCARVDDNFLKFTKSRGNDLSTPFPPHFPGLKPGDKWCLCASRWQEALEAGAAPPVVLKATHARALDFVSLSDLKAHAVDGDDCDDDAGGVGAGECKA